MTFGREITPLVRLALALLALATSLPAQQTALPKNEDCAGCHDSGPRTGRRQAGVPPGFNAAALKASPHAALDCVSCHGDVKEIPHSEKLARVDCGQCHSDEQSQYAASVHGKRASQGNAYAPGCKKCHGTHDILPPSNPQSPVSTMNIPRLCGGCHSEGTEVSKTLASDQTNILDNYMDSIHGQGLFKMGLTVTAVCTSCHTAHSPLPHNDPRSSIAKQNIAKTCTKCHARIETVHRKVIRGELWEKQPHLIPACVDCHEPHKIRKVFYSQGMSNGDCLSCHGNPALKRTTPGQNGSLFVDAADLGRLAPLPHRLRPVPHRRHSLRRTGLQHHQEQGGLLHLPRPGGAPIPGKHARHAGRAGQSRRAPLPGLPQHARHPRQAGFGLAHLFPQRPRPVRQVPPDGTEGRAPLYRQSGRYCGALPREHSRQGPAGSRPHGHRQLRRLPHPAPRAARAPIRDPASTAPTSPAPARKCHRGIYEQFTASVHSPNVTHTSKPLPVCDDCHSAHSIERTDLSDFRLNIMDQCGRCHREITASYFETFHGKVSKLGYLKTAKCFDCHGAHDILPVNNPRSHLSRNNIVGTCGKCHTGSHRQFAGYLTHATHHDPAKYPFLFFTFWGMTTLLIGTLVVSGAHTALWIPRSFEYRRRLKNSHPETGPYVRRFRRFHRNLHLMVVSSFLGLALTGMILKFSYAGWARLLAHLLGGFEAAGLIHRFCAVLTFTYFGLHLYDLVKKRRESGQSWLHFITGEESLLLNRRDWHELKGSLKWFFGRGPRPEYGRWTYWEKFDYFAVFWGVAIIGTTGLMLWFPEIFTRVFPGWAVNVATTIHSDEALLAVSFIFVVHFFNTHFRPEKFPIDTVIFTEGMPLEEFRRDRPREYRQASESGELERMMMPAPAPRDVRFWRRLGFTALTIGLILIGLIVYAMLFAYR